MFKVNIESKQLEKVAEASFNDIQCKERKDLQEWIVSEPSVLGEDLLIIQKEFADFENTNERLDLLALDKRGNLVIIENKTDDTGKNVVWQAVKYASYCSTLLAEEIKDVFSKYIQKYGLKLNAEQAILDFLEADSLDSLKLNEENSQRIILVAKTFRAEVLSAAYWLSNYGINISCIQIQPLKSGDEIFIDSKQILPQAEMKDFTIKLADKAKEIQQKQKALLKSEHLRSDFWEKFIPQFNAMSGLFRTISYVNRKDHWLGVSAGMGSGIHYNFLICKEYCGIELAIGSSDKIHNKKVFDALIINRAEIEMGMGNYAIDWERLDNATMSRIAIRNGDLSLYDTNSWDDIMKYLTELMILFESVMKKYISIIKKLK